MLQEVLRYANLGTSSISGVNAMSESWMKKMWSLVFRRKPVEEMSGGRPFTRCGTSMVYAGTLKLIPELIPESKPARRSTPPDSD